MTSSTISGDGKGNYKLNVKEEAAVGDELGLKVDEFPESIVSNEQASFDWSNDKAVENRIKGAESETRNQIAKYVITVFLCITCVIVVVGLISMMLPQIETIDLGNILETFSHFYLPVLTLVVGYYFGKDKV